MKFLSNVSLEATPSSSTDVVNVGYVQAILGQKIKDTVVVVSSSNFSGTYNSEQKTITQESGDAAAFTVDGITLVQGDRILLSGQTDKKENGIYTVSIVGESGTPGVIKRASDFEKSSDILPGVLIVVNKGTSYADTCWMLKTDGTITLDTTELEFERKTFKSSDVSIENKTDKYVGTITGDGSTTSFTVTHDLGTQDVITSIYDGETYEVVGCTITNATSNTITISTDIALTASKEYKVVVIG